MIKAKTKAEKAHLGRVAELGCIACRSDGYEGVAAEIHHPRAGVGMGQRAPHTDAIPLCPSHHRGIQHPKIPSIHLDKHRFIAAYGTEAELLETVGDLL
jgi:hypothetical protein